MGKKCDVVARTAILIASMHCMGSCETKSHDHNGCGLTDGSMGRR